MTGTQIPLERLSPEVRTGMLERLVELERAQRAIEARKKDAMDLFKEELTGVRDEITKILGRLNEDDGADAQSALEEAALRFAGAAEDGVSMSVSVNGGEPVTITPEDGENARAELKRRGKRDR